MSDPLLCTLDQGVALLTLNRPEKLNAISYELRDALLRSLDEIEATPAIRAVILTGAGDRAFSAGADITQFSQDVAQGPDAALRAFVRPGQALTQRIESFQKPVVAAVNGLAYGGGCEIAEAAHLAVASSEARFAKPEIARAMPPTFGGTQRLPRLVGRKRALEMLLTGEPIPAARALEIGLVNQVVAPAELLPAARRLVARILLHSGQAVARVLTAVARGSNLAIDEGLAVEAEQFGRMAATADLAEGLAAWRERRRPHYLHG